MAHANINLTRSYLREIGQFELLTAEDELKLGSLIKVGKEAQAKLDAGESRTAELDNAIAAGKMAREKLINCNLRLVVSEAKKYQNDHFTMLDLIGEGNLGLAEAADRYDISYGCRFSTCAMPWIKQAISKAIADKGKNIRIPAHIYNEIRRYRQTVTKLLSNGCDEPTPAAIAAEMGITEEKLADLLNWKNDTISLSTPLGDESDDTLEDVQSDDQNMTPDEKVFEEDRNSSLRRLINELPERTSKIIKMRYGLGGPEDPSDWNKEHTLEEIGSYLGITRERVRQIEKQTINDLRSNKKWKELMGM